MATSTNYYKVNYPPNLAAMCKENLSIPSSRPCYPQGWHGTMEQAATDAVVDLYNDADGFLLCHVTYVVGLNPTLPDKPQDGTVITLLDANVYAILLAQYTVLVTDGSNGLWTPAIWTNRWNSQPDTIYKEAPKDNEGPETMPKHLFKYMQKEHAKGLLYMGVVRIGTLYDYRKIEKYNAAIGDMGEGVKTILTKVDKLTDGSNEIPELFKDRIHLAGHVLPHVVFNETQHSPNLYVFCASNVYDTRLHKDFDTNVCVKIESPEKFIQALTYALRQRAEFVGFGKCRYMNKRLVSPDKRDFNPAFIKEAKPEFAKQREWRALWKPRSDIVEPFLTISDISRYCTMIK
jgi:hypothetical protein